MDERELAEKLRRIQALFAGATTDGERAAAAAAKDRVAARLREVQVERVVEFRYKLTNAWSRRLLVALMRRHGVEPYRRSGQRHTTVMAQITKRRSDEIWSEFMQLDEVLKQYFDEVAARVISQAVHADAKEAAEVEPAALVTDGNERTA
jgi:hypothetical protein